MAAPSRSRWPTEVNEVARERGFEDAGFRQRHPEILVGQIIPSQVLPAAPVDEVQMPVAAGETALAVRRGELGIPPSPGASQPWLPPKPTMGVILSCAHPVEAAPHSAASVRTNASLLISFC